MAEFEIRNVCQRLVHGDVTIGFERHVCDRMTGKRKANHQLRDDIETRCLVGNSRDNANRKHENDGYGNGGDQPPPGQVDGPGVDDTKGGAEGAKEDDVVPPIGDLGVPPHQFHVNIVVARAGALPLFYNLRAVVQECVCQDRSEARETNAVGDGEEGAESKRAILLVEGLIEGFVAIVYDSGRRQIMRIDKADKRGNSQDINNKTNLFLS
ncbi:hypothetical protein BC936DRAFT_149477 [Jimgerdemannia flammicorona]|uniref:Uncharacterized protein n=2 Tax=Jimgerdemannia flammicorona TaxID=994334 RepID=A0A433D0Q8_9FUNG|nr:hypothetical protein BC936DRAFT_149477 [Jimgerdemannia flammicorona]RUS27412.1 hypothetical protein BC938DRAFT_483294 [Jimgerdemannia flammicorona]